MGFFDRFGAGGGKLEIRPEGLSYVPGQTVQGYVVLTGGTRAQSITNVTLKLVLSSTEQAKGPQGVQTHHATRDVCPMLTVSGAFQTQPGQQYPFPFQFVLPQGLPASQPGAHEYRISASADIDGEVDPGAGLVLTIAGGTGAQAQPMAAPAGKPAVPALHADKGAVAGLHTDKGAVAGLHTDKGAVGGLHTDKGAVAVHTDKGAVAVHHDKGAVAVPQLGAKVYAQWTDGNWHPATVVAFEKGMIGVDWVDEKLGVSSWVQPSQVRV